MSTQNITHRIASLPVGWAGTPDQLIAWIADNLTSTFEAEVPSGVVGGTKPTEDLGVWYGPDGIESWRNGKYQPISDVPIGAIMPWGSLAASPPANYLMADGSLKAKATYPELANVLAASWALSTDTDGTQFRLPNLLGRIVMGSGIADFGMNLNPSNAIRTSGITSNVTPVVGKAPARTAGTYLGYTSPMRVTPWADMPTYTQVTGSTTNFVEADSHRQDTTPPVVVLNYIIRAR